LNINELFFGSLQTIHFDLQVDHPYAFIIKYAKTLKGEKNKIQKVVQVSISPTTINGDSCIKLDRFTANKKNIFYVQRPSLLH